MTTIKEDGLAILTRLVDRIEASGTTNLTQILQLLEISPVREMQELVSHLAGLGRQILDGGHPDHALAYVTLLGLILGAHPIIARRIPEITTSHPTRRHE